MQTVTTINQVGSLIIYIMILVLAAIIWFRWRLFRGLVLFPALWAGFGIVYYALLLNHLFTNAEVLLWGSYHRLMVGVMILAGMVALLAILIVTDRQRRSDGEGNDS